MLDTQLLALLPAADVLAADLQRQKIQSPSKTLALMPGFAHAQLRQAEITYTKINGCEGMYSGYSLRSPTAQVHLRAHGGLCRCTLRSGSTT